MSEVRQAVYELIANETSTPLSEIQPTSTLSDLNIQSLDVVQIIFAIEEQFKIYLPYNDPGFDISTVGGLVETVEGLVRDKQQAV